VRWIGWRLKLLDRSSVVGIIQVVGI
jgi:hypothetical protein